MNQYFVVHLLEPCFLSRRESVVKFMLPNGKYECQYGCTLTKNGECLIELYSPFPHHKIEIDIYRKKYEVGFRPNKPGEDLPSRIFWHKMNLQQNPHAFVRSIDEIPSFLGTNLMKRLIIIYDCL
jgi:hypothetical protein